MDLDEYRKERMELEDDILARINQFEEETGAHVERVRLSDYQIADSEWQTASVRVEDSV